MKKEDVIPGMRVKRVSGLYKDMKIGDTDTVMALVNTSSLSNRLRGVQLASYGFGHDYDSLEPVVEVESSNYLIF